MREELQVLAIGVYPGGIDCGPAGVLESTNIFFESKAYTYRHMGSQGVWQEYGPQSPAIPLRSSAISEQQGFWFLGFSVVP